jgi:hypothetical protein
MRQTRNVLKELQNDQIHLFCISFAFRIQHHIRAGSYFSSGNPTLTQAMADKLEVVYDRLLEIKLSAEQRGRFQTG